MKERCAWAGSDPLYQKYHDEEWGVPVHDDRKLFEMLILEGAQAGLSWSTILRKREGYRKAFAGFDPKKVARFDSKKVEQLMANDGIIRNRAKILAAINNARRFLEVQKEFGTFDAYMLVLRDYGTMSLADVLTPAIGYYMNGYPLVERASATIDTVKQNFRDNWPSSAAVYLPGNKVPAPASLFANKAAGNAYLRIVREAEAGGGNREAVIERARKVWSQGFVAEAIDRFYTHEEVMDVSGQRNRGLLRGEDLAKWQATIEALLTYDYGRYTVCKAGAWSQAPMQGARTTRTSGPSVFGKVASTALICVCVPASVSVAELFAPALIVAPPQPKAAPAAAARPRQRTRCRTAGRCFRGAPRRFAHRDYGGVGVRTRHRRA